MKLLTISPFLFLTTLLAAEIDSETLNSLNHESFEIREKTTNQLIQSDISITSIQKIIPEIEEPEIIHRLNIVIAAKIEASGWLTLKKQEIPNRAQPQGNEADGDKLYLVRINHLGNDIIGKYSLRLEGGNFPFGKQELHLPNFQTWIGNGTWKKWNPQSNKAIPMGTTSNGKTIYAARASFEKGLHMGTLIQGETTARISWGGKVELINDFEVLESE